MASDQQVTSYAGSVGATATLQTLVTFDGANGANPNGGLLLDAAGNLYGTTSYGGRRDFGTIFEIAKTPTGYSPTPTTLFTFNGSGPPGFHPGGNLLMDARGDIIGTARGGPYASPFARGSIYELVKTRAGFAARPRVLVRFRAQGGYYPNAGLISDEKGDIFGTTQRGSTDKSSFGTLFEVPKTAGGYGARRILVRFEKTAFSDNPLGGPGGIVLDSAGNLFGSAAYMGPSDTGEIYELVKTGNHYSSKPAVVADFSASSNLLIDKAGNILAASTDGPSTNGTIYEITKTGSGFTTTPVATFDGTNGRQPNSLAFDAAGNLYGTTSYGGAYDKGTVFEIAKTPTGYSSTPTTIYSFTGGTYGSGVTGPLTFDSAGHIFGVTGVGGAANQGTVFEITLGDGGATAVAAAAVCFVSGTRILTPRGEAAVEDLQPGETLVTASGQVRPIAWIGHRTVECGRHRTPHSVLPVRVARHAFGAERPNADLWLSPHHCVAVEACGEVLVPIGCLVNGTTIVQASVERVTYWHVELDSHDLLVANGLPAESYLEMGNRDFFACAPVPRLDAVPDARHATHADFCRPFVGGGPIVDAVRRALATRAEAMGRGSGGDRLAS